MTPRSWVEIDLGALRRNFRRMRQQLGPGIRIYGVCKGDAYGTGIDRVAPVLVEEGADGIAVGDPEEAARLRAAGMTAPILLYGGTDPTMAAETATLDVIMTVFDDPGLRALASIGRPVEVFAKLDCGFGRLGFVPEDWGDALAILRAAPNLKLRGLYTHLAAVEDAQAVQPQLDLFEAAARSAAAAGFANLELMVASSRVAIGYPDHLFNAVNPGRLLYGMLDPPWDAQFEVDPVVSRIVSRVIQVKTVAPDRCMGYGGITLTKAMRAAVLPIGFVAGLPRQLHGATVLIHGRPTPTIGLASMEHLLIDVSAVPEIAVGEQAVLLGRQGDAAISAAEFARSTGLEALEILTRMARSLPRLYLD